MRFLLNILFVCSFFSACSQSYKNAEKQIIFINPSSVINNNDPEVKMVLSTWEKYLQTKDSLYEYNPYWSSIEYKNKKYPDLFYKDINHSTLFNIKNYYKPTVLSVEKVDSSYIIKTLFASGEKDNGFNRVSAILNIEAIKENNEWRLKSMEDRILKSLYKQYNSKEITYYYHKDHVLDTLLCSKFNIENNKLAHIFQTNTINVKYFLCKKNKEIQKIKGFDFANSMGYPNQISGLAEPLNNIIYAGNDSEWYLHELVHLYVYKLYGSNVNNCINEGIATYYGGSLGNTLEYHLHKVALYVKNNPVDFSNLSKLERIDDETNFQYTIGGLLCKTIDTKLGFNGIKKLLALKGDSDELLWSIIQELLNIKNSNFNDFIHNELNKYN
ncbi:MAG: hypothetical protein QM669_08320 [Siphonobacter sp.]